MNKKCKAKIRRFSQKEAIKNRLDKGIPSDMPKLTHKNVKKGK
jgi:hypothetical protein